MKKVVRLVKCCDAAVTPAVLRQMMLPMDNDDGDDDVLTLPVVAKQAVAKIHIDGRKKTRQFRYVRETVLTSCVIPSPATCNQITPGT